MDVVTETPTVGTPAVDAPSPEDTSIADHAAKFGAPDQRQEPDSETPEVEPRHAILERNDRGQYQKQPHRAQSHRAGAKDVEEIQAQTARLRQAEQDAGIAAPDKKPGESDRAYNLRRQADIAEALRDAKKAGSTTSRNGSGTRQDAPGATNGAGNGYKAAPFTKPAPNPEEFANHENPLAAYARAISAHEREEWLHNLSQFELQKQAEEGQRQAQETHAQQLEQHKARMQATAAARPDFMAKLTAVDDIKIPDVLAHTIFTDDKSGELMYALAAQPNKLLEVSLIAAPLGRDDQSVGLLRRWMHSQIQGAGATPSGPPAFAQTVAVAPRPPRPLGTGPMKTRDEPPSDITSIADHARYYGPKTRR